MNLETALLIAILIAAIVIVAYCFAIHRQLSQGGESGLTELLLGESRANRREATEASERLRDTVDKQMKQLRESNEKKLEQMRSTVDEKLQSTLEKRLGESFKQVTERLEKVHQGLGEMQNLAAGVGDLKRVLTNVKARGTWGEYQIGDILGQFLTLEQYQKNVQPKPGSRETVEYAVKLPGMDDDSQVWLPIDAKFPQEDYQRLLNAAEAADAKKVEECTAALEREILKSAKEIAQKYLAPPNTTDFAIMFLPTEGLYAEVLRRPGLMDKLQACRVVAAGPTTLSALLSSFRMGFRTLAIEKRSSEVWNVLRGVKTEFGKFGDVLKKVKKQLSSASETLDDTIGRRTRAMDRELRNVETLPDDEAAKLPRLDETPALPQSGERAMTDES